MRWLALDIGSKNVGVAICDSDESVVTALAPLRFSDPAQLAHDVARLTEERGAGGVVVGVPVTRNGESRGERRVAGVLVALRARLAVPVETADERGTSREAEALLRDAGIPPRRFGELIDGVAARLILETFLARRARNPV